MKTFIEQLTEDLYERHHGQMGDLCLITPNRRARLFIRKHLEKMSQTSVWMPEILTLEEFLQKNTGLIAIDKLPLLLEFYTVYVDFKGAEAESFDHFADWASEALAEFNDIDMAMADPEALFNHLSEAKAVELWHPDDPVLTANELIFLERFRSLKHFYFNLKERLRAKQLAYPGMLFRVAAENIDTILNQPMLPALVFAGFNALTPSEEKILKTAYSMQKAKFYWDADDYYVRDTMQEAGHFLRKHEKWCKPFLYLNDFLGSQPKQIQIIGTPKRVGQAEQAGRILADIPSDKIADTCLVLASEDLLLPVLHTIPAKLGAFNVTMGYPLKLSLASTFINNVFELHLKSIPFKGRFYHKNLKQLLNHPWINGLSVESKDEGLTNDLQGVFFSREQITDLLQRKIPCFSEVFAPLFHKWPKASELLQAIVKVMQQMYEHFANTGTDTATLEMMFESIEQSSKLLSALAKSGISPETDTLKKLLDRLFRNASVAFYGEPLQGLQVMGMLETRSLDFENLIIVGVNENALPNSKTLSGIIPLDIRSHYNLTTYRDRDAIYAYHFYRLLQRAQNIWLIYNTSTDNMGEGERSRFIDQIVHEMPAYNPNIQITEEIIATPLKPDLLKASPIIIPKTDEHIKILEQYATERGFSPSALQTFSNCSLKFYFQYIEKLRADEEPEEEPDAKGIGNIIHKALEDIFHPLIGKILNPEDINSRLSLVEELCKEAFVYYYRDIDAEAGKNLIWLNISQKLIENYLKDEMFRLGELHNNKKELQIIDLETDLQRHLLLDDGRKILLKGRADRIDLETGLLQIIDFKTGSIKKDKLPDMDSFLYNDDFKVPSQLALYAWMAAGDSRFSVYLISAAFVNMRKYKDHTKTILINDSETLSAEIAEQLGTALREFVQRIFNKEEPFSPTENLRYCEYCDFRSICNR